MPKISVDCKLYKNCPFLESYRGKRIRACEKEFRMVYGKNWKNPKATIIWSIQICYATKNLIDKGLIKYGIHNNRRKIK